MVRPSLEFLGKQILIWVSNFSRRRSNYINSGLTSWIVPFLDLILSWSYYNVFKFYSFQWVLLVLAASGNPLLVLLHLVPLKTSLYSIVFSFFSTPSVPFNYLDILSYLHLTFTIPLHQHSTFISMLTRLTWFNLLFFTSSLIRVVPF